MAKKRTGKDKDKSKRLDGDREHLDDREREARDEDELGAELTEDPTPEEVERLEREIAEVKDETFNPAVEKLRKDLLEAAARMPKRAARFLVDSYYKHQRDRIRADHQIESCREANEPAEAVEWLYAQSDKLETSIKKVLGAYAERFAVGRWSMGLFGIGPVISAGLLAHLDITKAPTAGHIWSFAGQVPGVLWLGRAKADALVAEVVAGKHLTDEEIAAIAARVGRGALQLDTFVRAVNDLEAADVMTRAHMAKGLAMQPWNARLKTLCWKIGECLVKFSKRDKASLYSRLYRQRKLREIEKNERGDFADIARQTLASKNFRKASATRDAYESGKLPDGRIKLRAMRYAVKILLAHWQTVAYFEHYGRMPPKPYVLTYLGHTDEIQIPDWPWPDRKKVA